MANAKKCAPPLPSVAPTITVTGKALPKTYQHLQQHQHQHQHPHHHQPQQQPNPKRVEVRWLQSEAELYLRQWQRRYQQLEGVDDYQHLSSHLLLSNHLEQYEDWYRTAQRILDLDLDAMDCSVGYGYRGHNSGIGYGVVGVDGVIKSNQASSLAGGRPLDYLWRREQEKLLFNYDDEEDDDEATQSATSSATENVDDDDDDDLMDDDDDDVDDEVENLIRFTDVRDGRNGWSSVRSGGRVLVRDRVCNKVALIANDNGVYRNIIADKNLSLKPEMDDKYSSLLLSRGGGRTNGTIRKEFSDQSLDSSLHSTHHHQQAIDILHSNQITPTPPPTITSAPLKAKPSARSTPSSKASSRSSSSSGGGGSGGGAQRSRARPRPPPVRRQMFKCEHPGCTYQSDRNFNFLRHKRTHRKNRNNSGDEETADNNNRSVVVDEDNRSLSNNTSVGDQTVDPLLAASLCNNTSFTHNQSAGSMLLCASDMLERQTISLAGETDIHPKSDIVIKIDS